MVFANWKRFSSSAILAVLAGLLATGCGPANGGGEGEGEGEGEAPGELVRSEKARVTSPALPEGDLAELVAGNSAFAFDLYQQVRDEDGNIFYSPHSISIALAMTYAGARNETEQEMADTLQFTLPQDRLHAAFNALDLELASRGQDTSGTDGEGFRLNIVNRIWGEIGWSFVPEFLDVLAQNYGAGLSLLDFTNEPEESRLAINEWVSDRTEGRIEDLLPQGIFEDLGDSVWLPLVLTNAIYFKAAWSRPFSAEATRDGPFNLFDGSQVTVPMMRQVGAFGYAAGDGYQAIQLAYEGAELSMVVFLPDTDRFDEFDSTLDAARVETIVQDLNGRELDLTVPRFTFEWGVNLDNQLAQMGMPSAFDQGLADLSGMISTGLPLAIGVTHKTFVAVDEEGTEAAAVTVVTIGGAESEPEEPLVVTIDRPFVFVIRDAETGTILFVGRVLDPSAS